MKIGSLGRFPSFFISPKEAEMKKISFLLYYMILTFSFALMQKKKITKRKNQGCTFLPTPALYSAKQKELAVAQTAFCF